MPRPRFYRLSEEKRERILEAAAKEFTAHGYDGASMNSILQAAAISKGAAYYYFDDKADLFATTVQHYSEELIADIAFDPTELTADNFWDGLADVYRRQFTSFAERPWVFGIAKAGGPVPADTLLYGPLAEIWQQAQTLLAGFLQHGRDLGVIRDDLPEELLLSLLVTVDDAHDRWLYAHWAELSPDELEQAALRISDTLRRLLSVNGDQ
ncbi:MAG: TetR/AcrR family transcriptional regulator [Chloroflexota bacterium]